MDAEKQVKHVGDPAGNQHYWASCYNCPNEICVYQPDTEEGRLEAERIMEEEESWWYVDGTWLCSVCQ